MFCLVIPSTHTAFPLASSLFYITKIFIFLFFYYYLSWYLHRLRRIQNIQNIRITQYLYRIFTGGYLVGLSFWAFTSIITSFKTVYSDNKVHQTKCKDNFRRKSSSLNELKKYSNRFLRLLKDYKWRKMAYFLKIDKLVFL